MRFTMLLSCGWLLFTLPITPDVKSVDYDQPLSRWQHAGSYDSAKDCEDTKSAVVMALKRSVDLGDKNAQLNLRAYVSGRCVPTDALGFKIK